MGSYNHENFCCSGCKFNEIRSMTAKCLLVVTDFFKTLFLLENYVLTLPDMREGQDKKVFKMPIANITD